jgi:hypothetical protein
LVEQLIRNQQVIGSSPIAGSRNPNKSCELGLSSASLFARGQQLVSTELRFGFLSYSRRTLFVRPVVMLRFDGWFGAKAAPTQSR